MNLAQIIVYRSPVEKVFYESAGQAADELGLTGGLLMLLLVVLLGLGLCYLIEWWSKRQLRGRR